MFNDIVSPAGIIGLIGMLAAGWAVVKHATVKTLRDTVTDLRGQLADRGTRIEDLEHEAERTQTTVDGLREGIASRDRDLEALAKVVTGEVHWEALEQMLHDLIDRVRNIAERLETLLKRKP